MTKLTPITAENPVLADVVATLWYSGCYQQMTLEEMVSVVSVGIPALADLDIEDCRAALRRLSRQLQIRKPKPRREPVAV